MEAVTFKAAIGNVLHALSTVPAFMMTLAVVYFIYGIMRFIASAGDEGRRTEGKKTIVWSIIAMFLTVAVWAIVTLILDTIGINDSSLAVLRGYFL